MKSTFVLFNGHYIAGIFTSLVEAQKASIKTNGSYIEEIALGETQNANLASWSKAHDFNHLSNMWTKN